MTNPTPPVPRSPEIAVRDALRIIENAECAAQLEIKDRSLRSALVRSICRDAFGQKVDYEDEDDE